MTEGANVGANANDGRSERARNAALFVPLVLVNMFAVFGQAAWAHDHITPAAWESFARWLLAVLFACAVESIGVYLAIEAHAALTGDQSSGLLRTGSYAVGLCVGALNYDHWSGERFAITAAAVTFGALSAISPWLWAIRSRSLNRDRLRELHLLDERGVKLSTSRKFWHPILSLKVTRWAAWAGVTEPAAAVAGWTAADAPKATKPKHLPTAPSGSAPSQALPASAVAASNPSAVPARRGGRGLRRTTPQQKTKALSLLDEGKRASEAAIAVGVSKRRVEMWRKDRDEANGGVANVDVANS
jgi:hypothetical protein